eukprot:INCI707.1.p1 GENE.INCI707.1~~INCI707.1.p1  ORF type:complete len:366 (+),score=61.36 INCI707.1:246-1343(+)
MADQPNVATNTPQRPGAKMTPEQFRRVQQSREAALARKKNRSVLAFLSKKPMAPGLPAHTPSPMLRTRSKRMRTGSPTSGSGAKVARKTRAASKARLSQCQGIDALFRADTDANDGMGGFPCGEIIEISGVSTSGKTQLCYTVCAHALRSTVQAAAEGSDTTPPQTKATKCVWLSSHGCNFYPKRLLEIGEQISNHASKNGAECGSKSMLDAVLVARAYNTNHLFYLLEKVLQPKLQSDDCDVGVVVLDGILHMVKTEFQSSAKEKKSAMEKLLAMLQKLAVNLQTPVLLTNQVIANLQAGCDGPTSVFSENDRFVCDLPCRLRLHRRSTSSIAPRSATRLSTGFQCAFDITSAGVVDIEDSRAK